MTKQKGRLRLDSESYELLRLQVLRRDSWRCQYCGSMKNLEVHHQQFRSQCGGDSEQNLITLCRACHNQTHNNNLSQISWCEDGL